jgi:hypothetical protein
MISDSNLKSLRDDFLKVARLAGVTLPANAISIERLPAPHRPPSALPQGKMAVYAFFWKSQCLKVGKAGPKSHARFSSQHYSPTSSRSNLSKSLVRRQGELGLSGISESNVGDWIKSNVGRANFLLNAEIGIPVLSLLESFLQCSLRPQFEGFKSQR